MDTIFVILAAVLVIATIAMLRQKPDIDDL